MATNNDSLPLLSRVADSLYWMARYMERAENMARLLEVNLHLPFFLERLLQAGQVPLLFHGLLGHIGAHDISQCALAQVGDGVAHSVGLEDLVALLVDHLALVVRDVVVLQQLLAHVEVVAFDLRLGVGDRPRDHPVLDRDALFPAEALHEPLDAVAGEAEPQADLALVALLRIERRAIRLPQEDRHEEKRPAEASREQHRIPARHQKHSNYNSPQNI